MSPNPISLAIARVLVATGALVVALGCLNVPGALLTGWPS
jgi:hypothetical protein